VDDGEHPAVLVAVRGQAEGVIDAGGVDDDGLLGDVQPAGDGGVAEAFGDEVSTSRRRGLSESRAWSSRRLRFIISSTTSGSRTVPPLVTRRRSRQNAGTSRTRWTYCDSIITGVLGRWARMCALRR
jgi:hypothetical protein